MNLKKMYRLTEKMSGLILTWILIPNLTILQEYIISPIVKYNDETRLESLVGKLKKVQIGTNIGP